MAAIIMIFPFAATTVSILPGAIHDSHLITSNIAASRQVAGDKEVKKSFSSLAPQLAGGPSCRRGNLDSKSERTSSAGRR